MALALAFRIRSLCLGGLDFGGLGQGSPVHSGLSGRGLGSLGLCGRDLVSLSLASFGLSRLSGLDLDLANSTLVPWLC